MERTLNGPAHASACLAADGSGASGAPRDDDPARRGIDLGDMLEMGLESLLMHFRRKPGEQVRAEVRTKNGESDVTRIEREGD